MGVRGAEAAPTTDLEPVQDSSLELGFPNCVLTMCARFFPYRPTDVQFLDLVFYLNSVSLKTILHDSHL